MHLIYNAKLSGKLRVGIKRVNIKKIMAYYTRTRHIQLSIISLDNRRLDDVIKHFV